MEGSLGGGRAIGRGQGGWFSIFFSFFAVLG